MTTEWLKVTKQNPCHICKKIDWCTFTEDGASCCMRVQSPKPMKNGGWLHRETSSKFVYVPPVKVVKQVEPTINCFQIWKDWSKVLKAKYLIGLGSQLGLDGTGLWWLGGVWADEHHAFAFPMYDENRNIIGLRLRNMTGEKWAVKGSKTGIFLNQFYVKHPLENPVFICEGVTDASAAMEMGFSAIGRPSCAGGEDIILAFLKINKIKRVVIVSDNDTPGLRGAEKLQSVLKIPSCVFIPPAKDLREFLKLGGNAETVNATIKNLVWKNP